MRPAQIGFPQLLQDFFLRRLIAQRGASARTVEAYRDAFELLLGFAQRRSGKPPWFHPNDQLLAFLQSL